MRCRELLFFLFLFSPLSAFAQHALILIPHVKAQPVIPTADYFHEEWIRWPADQAGLNNRILSLACGVDLQAESADMGFRLLPGGARLSRNGGRLAARGFFEARETYRGDLLTSVVLGENGTVSPGVLLLALTSPEETLRPRTLSEVAGKGGLVVAEANGWDDVDRIARGVGGRSLVVEYPPDGTDGWSRFWKRGPWPVGAPTERDLGVPGLIRARRALALLLRPETFEWQTTDVGHWGGANRWLEHGHGVGEDVLLVWFLTAALVFAWAFAQVMNEDRGPFVSEVLVVLALSPAAFGLAGGIARLGGLEGWPLWISLATLALYGVARLLSYVLRQTHPEAHPLLPACLLGLLVMTFFDPLWSDLSGRFGRLDVEMPSLALGAFVAYLTGAAAFARGRGFGRALIFGVLVLGATAHPWWIDGHPAFLVLPAVAWAASEGLFRPALLLVVACLPTGLYRMVKEGVAWNPGDLPFFADQAGATNLWRDAVFLISPLWVGTLLFLATLGLVGNRFLAYRLGRLLRHDPRLRALPWVAAATLALGVTEPLAVPAAPIVGFGALLALAYDGLRGNA